LPVKKCLKEGDALSPSLFNCALEYAVKRVPEKEDGLKLNDTYKFLVYASNVNSLGGTQKLV
jgi:hypothetical protein